ncbi:hypothetical protein GCM10020001_114120 [Nonomuraea salmonea]
MSSPRRPVRAHTSSALMLVTPQARLVAAAAPVGVLRVGSGMVYVTGARISSTPGNFAIFLASALEAFLT